MPIIAVATKCRPKREAWHDGGTDPEQSTMTRWTQTWRERFLRYGSVNGEHRVDADVLIRDQHTSVQEYSF